MVCDFLGFVKSFFSETPHGNLPVRSIKKTTSCKKGDRITRLDLLVDWPEKYFSGGTDFDTSGTRLVRKSAQGLIEPLK